MTINIRLRKGSTAVITESVIDRVFSSREPGETINVDVHPGARAVVAEDGATAEELKSLLQPEAVPEEA